MRLSGTKTGSANQYNGLGDQLYDLGGARPTLDLNFANNGSLVDSVTGKTLVQHTRASSATYVDGDGVIRNAVTNYVRNSEDLNATGWGIFGSGTGLAPVVTADAGIAPDGTQTAWQVDFDRGAGTASTDQSNVVSDPVETTVGKRVFHSVYLKTTDGSTKILRFDFNGAGANVSPYNNSVITVTGEWQRFIIGYDATITERKWVLRLRGTQTPNDQPTASVYLWHPQTELLPINTGSPGEYVPTTSTINSAPRFDHEVTRTTTNLISYSEELDDASWGGGASGNATVTPNAIAAPFGSITADLLDDTSTTQVQARSQNINIVSSTGSYTLSAFVRPNTSSIVSLRLGLGGATTINGEVVVDLATGAAQWRSGANVGTSFAITSAGGDWYRISVTVTDNGTGNNGASIELRPAFALTYTDTLNVTAQGSAYFWGVQLEQNDDVGPYVKTTGAAATKVDTESLGLLVEESRTNLLLRSEEFDDPAAWTVGGLNITTNAGSAPNNTTSAEKVVPTITTTAFKELKQDVSITSGTTYTFSQFVKADGYRYVQIVGNSAVFGGFSINFDLQTGLETRFDASTSTVVGKGITNFGNGWYRVHASVTAGSTALGRMTVNIISSATSARGEAWSGDGTSGVLFWGAQLEASPYATSYIPTQGSTATRAADVSTSAATFGNSWYRQDEGTVFADSLVKYYPGTTQFVYQLGGGSFLHSLRQPQGTGSTFRAVIGNTFSSAPGTGGNAVDGSVTKAAIAYTATNGRLQVGTSGTDVTPAGIADSNQITFGNNNGTISRLTYWPSRLSNDTLQTITV